jgi:PhnB protein
MTGTSIEPELWVERAGAAVRLVLDDPDAVVARAMAAGATETAPVEDEHGWRLGRIIDPFGHEREIGTPR